MSCKVGNQTNSQDPQAVNSRVFVGNLNTFQCSKTDVERMFQRYGRIAGISMHKGYAFIQFTNPFDARSACLGEDGRLLWGQTLDVNMVAEPKAHQTGRKRQNIAKTGNDCCLSDYIDLDIYDLRDRMTFHRRFCGGSLPAPLLVLHPKAKLVFRTNHAVHHRGFFATFEFVDEGEVMPPKVNGTHQCGHHITDGGGGEIRFPGRNQEQSMPLFGLDCIWLLRVSYTNRIYIRVQDLEFQGSIENCQKAQLGIYDGYEHSLDESTVLKKFCGDQLHYKVEDDRALLSSRNRILVRFQTHSTDPTKDVALLDKNIGFRIVWSEVSSEETTDACVKNKRFACQETRACISKDHLGAFSVCPELIYCISQDLVCDGVSHCAETDASDEKNCFTRSLNALIIGGPASLLIILLLTFCTIVVRRKKLLKQVRISFLCWKDQKKKKSINGYVLDNPIHSPFIGLPRIDRTTSRGQQCQDTSSVESASICPLSDSESSDVSICPFHGTKFMNHLPVVHEVYNLDSDDSSPISPNDPRCRHGSNSPPPPPPPAPSGHHLHHLHHHQLHTWRLKTRPMKRTNAVCLSDECKSSSGEDESPCLCGGVGSGVGVGVGGLGLGNTKTMNLSALMGSSCNNDKIDDSGIELLDSFDLHSNHPNEQIISHHISSSSSHLHMGCKQNSNQTPESGSKLECVSPSGHSGHVCCAGNLHVHFVHRAVQTEDEVVERGVGPLTPDEYDDEDQEEDENGDYCLSPRAKVKVKVKVREVGTNTTGNATLPHLHSVIPSSNHSNCSMQIQSSQSQSQGQSQSQNLIQSQSQSQSQGVMTPQVKIYKPLCSTVTTFGVYPESTSTDV